MRVEDFELPGLCQICGEDLASVYVVISRARFTAKAHVCFECFGELEECGGEWVEPVSLQEFKETVETDGSSEERGVLNTESRGTRSPESTVQKGWRAQLPSA
jgi:hypothetical protein